MADESTSIPKNANIRQTIEGMPLLFCQSAAGDLQAVIQFDVGGADPGIYHLKIRSGDCTFWRGPAASPTMTIKTPSEVWLDVASGRLSGQDALFKGLYKVQGDAALLLKMGDMFKATDDFSIRDTSAPVRGPVFPAFRRSGLTGQATAGAGCRPAGPLPLSGMSWMTLLFIPWTLYWVLFDIRSVSPWLSAGLPFLSMSLIALYRLIFNRPAWVEIASIAFFLAACVLGPVMGNQVFLTWGSVIGSLYMGLLWLISLAPMIKLPFSAEYSKWGFTRKLWGNSMFIQPNLAISLAWGWEFIIASGFGIAARMWPAMFIPLTVVRYSLMIPAAIFTTGYQKGVLDRRFADIDKTISTLRAWAFAGIAITLAVLALVCFFLVPPA